MNGGGWHSGWHDTGKRLLQAISGAPITTLKTGRRLTASQGFESLPSAELALSEDEGEAEAVVSLAADGLDRRRFDAGLGGEELVEAALGGDCWIVVVGVY
jgi:hypothetical protein